MGSNAHSQIRTRRSQKQGKQWMGWDVFCDAPGVVKVTEGFQAKVDLPLFTEAFYKRDEGRLAGNFYGKLGNLLFMRGSGNFYKNQPPQKCGEWAGAFAQRSPEYSTVVEFFWKWSSLYYSQPNRFMRLSQVPPRPSRLHEKGKEGIEIHDCWDMERECSKRGVLLWRKEIMDC